MQHVIHVSYSFRLENVFHCSQPSRMASFYLIFVLTAPRECQFLLCPVDGSGTSQQFCSKHTRQDSVVGRCASVGWNAEFVQSDGAFQLDRKH